MPTLQKFFANIQSTRDNGASIELNLRGSYYYDPGRYSGQPEDCYEAESEISVTRCEVLTEMPGNRYNVLTVDFYEFSESEQERFIDAAIQNMEADD